MIFQGQTLIVRYTFLFFSSLLLLLGFVRNLPVPLFLGLIFFFIQVLVAFFIGKEFILYALQVRKARGRPFTELVQLVKNAGHLGHLTDVQVYVSGELSVPLILVKSFAGQQALIFKEDVARQFNPKSIPPELKELIHNRPSKKILGRTFLSALGLTFLWPVEKFLLILKRHFYLPLGLKKEFLEVIFWLLNSIVLLPISLSQFLYGQKATTRPPIFPRSTKEVRAYLIGQLAL